MSTGDFAEFLIRIIKATCSVLGTRYPGVTLDVFEEKLLRREITQLTGTLLNDWRNHAWGNGTALDYEGMVSVTLIDLLGFLNRLELSGKVDRPAFNHAFLSTLSKALHHEKLKAAFILQAHNLMANKAA